MTSKRGDFLALAVLQAWRLDDRTRQKAYRLSYVDRVRGVQLADISGLALGFLSHLDRETLPTDPFALVIDANGLGLGPYQDLRDTFRTHRSGLTRHVAFRGVVAGGGTSIARDPDDRWKYTVSRDLIVEPLRLALSKAPGEVDQLDATGLPTEQADQLAEEMWTYRQREHGNRTRLDHAPGGHDDALSAAGAAYWAARELRGRMGGHTTVALPSAVLVPPSGPGGRGQSLPGWGTRIG